MCRVLREGPVLCLNQCVFGVDMRSNVSAMCFLVGCVCALVFKVLWHVVISYFRQRWKRSCAVNVYALALKSSLT